MLRFTPDHTWILIDGESAKLGITTGVIDVLGEIVIFSPPPIGTSVLSGATLLTLESSKVAWDMPAPTPGTVTAINHHAHENPECLNVDPMGTGWLVRMVLSELAVSNSLMDESAYCDLISED